MGPKLWLELTMDCVYTTKNDDTFGSMVGAGNRRNQTEHKYNYNNYNSYYEK